MKNVLLPVHDDCGQESRLQAALELVRATNGHLSCISIAEPPLVIAGDYMFSAQSAVLVSDAAQDAVTHRERIERRLALEDVPWDMTEVTGSFADALAVKASLADVIVLNSRLSDPASADMPSLAASVLFETRKPVLVVPEKGVRFDPLSKAVIAWDGSDPATSAMRAATPLLALAGEVTLVEVVNGRSGTSAEDAASYLSRHGVHVEIARSTADGVPVAQTILEECRQRSAYCVMGAFGRSRLSEALFGGVSRRMLTETSVPLFMMR